MFIQENLNWLVPVLAFIGAELHYVNGVRKGTITAGPLAYWIEDSPGASIATVLVLGGLVVGALTTDVFVGMKDAAVVLAALMLGYTMDSVIAPKTKPGG